MSEHFYKKRSYKRANTKTNNQGEDEDGPGHLLVLHPHLFGPQHEPHVTDVPPCYVKSSKEPNISSVTMKDYLTMSLYRQYVTVHNKRYKPCTKDHTDQGTYLSRYPRSWPLCDGG